MFIEDKKLLELLEQEAKIEEDLKEAKDELESISKRAEEIRLENKDKTDEHSIVRQAIAKIIVPIVTKDTEEFEAFGNPEIKEGKPFIKIYDVRPEAEQRAVDELKEIKENWLKYISKPE